jgi:hypothetical protein
MSDELNVLFDDKGTISALASQQECRYFILEMQKRLNHAGITHDEAYVMADMTVQRLFKHNSTTWALTRPIAAYAASLPCASGQASSPCPGTPMLPVCLRISIKPVASLHGNAKVKATMFMAGHANVAVLLPDRMVMVLVEPSGRTFFAGLKDLVAGTLLGAAAPAFSVYTNYTMFAQPQADYRGLRSCTAWSAMAAFAILRNPPNTPEVANALFKWIHANQGALLFMFIQHTLACAAYLSSVRWEGSIRSTVR